MLTTAQFYITESQKIKHNKIHGSEIIKDFGLSTDDYIVFASGAMVAHGLMDKNEDIDMYIKPNKFKILVKNGKLKKFTKFDNTLTYYADPTETADCSDHFLIGNKSEKWWFDHTEVIDGIRVLSIDGLKYFYKELYKNFGREKHKKRLDILEKL